jgi:hypothetical protein
MITGTFDSSLFSSSSREVSLQSQQTQNGKNFQQAIKDGDLNGKNISTAYLFEFTATLQTKSTSTFSAQSFVDDFKKLKEALSKIDTSATGYEGKKLDQLTQSEAKDLVSSSGFFGQEQTSTRLANFVLSGAGDNLSLLKAGREGIKQGFDEAEKIWGEKLPDLSYATLGDALKLIDDAIVKQGGSVLDVQG